MALTEQELQREKEYLETVKHVINKIINDANQYIDKRKNSLNTEKKFMWDNLSDYTDKERAIALSEMDHNVELTNKQILSLNNYHRALNSPYFAKLDFKFAEGYQQSIYIGITSVSDNLDFYVFDWRAPISSMFYNYELGKAKYVIPEGEVSGELLSKIQFKIVDGNLIRCFKSDINIDDEYLQEILANSSTEKMKNIVSTIQREQNEIIRNIIDKNLIVQGVAGSGKTSVALHRIAYLLYKDLQLNSNNILIFSPNDVFSDYISEVLPELGEENVLKTTFSDFSSAFLKPYKNIESYTEFLERVYNNPKINKELITYKMSDKFKVDLEAYLKNYIKNIKFQKGISLRGKLITSLELKDLLVNKYQKLPILERINKMVDHICHSLGIPQKTYGSKIKKFIIDFSEIELNYIKLYKSFLNDTLKDTKFGSKQVNFEDIVGLIYMNFELNGYPNYNYIRQIVIDEVQDYTEFQISIMKKIFKNASFTLLGDTNQTINPCYKYETLKKLSKIFDCSRYLELSKTYRSSEEIINYSNKILGIKNVCAVRKNTNIPVEIKSVTKNKIEEILKEDISLMNKQGIYKIAIITKNVKNANFLFEVLANSSLKESIELISDSKNIIRKNIIIIPSYLAKGLEFDGVIVYNDKDMNYTVEEKNLYYVVCTRAQHKLNVYNEPDQIYGSSSNI